MSKKIDYISINSSMLHWLIDKLKTEKNFHDSKEFLQAIEALACGESSSLMMELSETANVRISDKHLVCGELEIFPSTRKVLKNKIEIALTPKEFDILLFLARNKGEIFTKEQIYQAVWVNEYLMDDSNIMAFIRKLRKKIEPNPDAPEYIITIWGIGYKFNEKY